MDETVETAPQGDAEVAGTEPESGQEIVDTANRVSEPSGAADNEPAGDSEAFEG